MSTHYLRPGRLELALTRPLRWLARSGVSPFGMAELAVRGRTSGTWRTTPVNPLTHQDQRYLVAARGHTQWVRNLRAAGQGELRQRGRRVVFHAREVADADKAPLLRAYLRRWGWEVGRFFDGVNGDSTDEQLLAVAHRHPVFRIVREERPDGRR
ncbi:nitroreductase family deazaflavin-dependent oxidoreductase [Streptomyces oceani]|uniref:Deazaflavin-dependent nitroreductase n=1 Tax=Streptomyces oceani TaxID=1075402 RepID=A0A1E7JXV3_9ACTN|nr:nitroreductase family deazaflavin-dependent oxidoreductase [Streptomyces oceani]OEU96508.1 hypothetical protein AN216_19640 [Streptomyces oceani]